MFQFTAWLPFETGPSEIDGRRVALDTDLSGWLAHFDSLGYRWEIRRNELGQTALFREGRDVFRPKG